MIKQWSKNPEYVFYLFTNRNHWYLPFGIGWHYCSMDTGKCYSVSLHFLRFGIELEIWRWKNGNKN